MANIEAVKRLQKSEGWTIVTKRLERSMSAALERLCDPRHGQDNSRIVDFDRGWASAIRAALDAPQAIIDESEPANEPPPFPPKDSPLDEFDDLADFGDPG